MGVVTADVDLGLGDYSVNPEVVSKWLEGSLLDFEYYPHWFALSTLGPAICLSSSWRIAAVG